MEENSSRFFVITILTIIAGFSLLLFFTYRQPKQTLQPQQKTYTEQEVTQFFQQWTANLSQELTKLYNKQNCPPNTPEKECTRLIVQLTPSSTPNTFYPDYLCSVSSTKK